VKSPSTDSEPFELYEKLIEERTGKAEALPEMVEAPKVSQTCVLAILQNRGIQAG
jgi:hypothetical protein